MKVLIYNGEHSAKHGPYNTAEALANAGIEYKFIQNISKTILTGYDVLVMPGGDGGRAYLTHFTANQKQAIKEFVYDGGGYFGTCAGAYMALNTIYDGNVKLYNGLGITPNLNGKAIHIDTDSTPILFVDPGCKKVNKSPGTQYMSHYQGPAMFRIDKNSTNTSVIAVFNDPRREDLYPYGAILKDVYGTGNVILSSPHPELAPKDYKLVVDLIKLANNGGGSMGLTNCLDTCKDCQIKADDFVLMVNAVKTYRSRYMIYDKTKIRIRKDGVVSETDYVTYLKFKEMDKRWQTWLSTNNNTPPAFIWINKPTTPTPTPEPGVGPIQKQIQDRTGKQFNNFTEFYALIKKYCYYCNPWYFDDKKTKQQEIDMICNNINGIHRDQRDEGNCCDWAQIGEALAHEMGYETMLHGVWCPTYGINHAIFIIKGKEFGEWTAIDLAAAAESGYSIGNHWCGGWNFTKFSDGGTKEPEWLRYER